MIGKLAILTLAIGTQVFALNQSTRMSLGNSANFDTSHQYRSVGTGGINSGGQAVQLFVDSKAGEPIALNVTTGGSSIALVGGANWTPQAGGSNSATVDTSGLGAGTLSSCSTGSFTVATSGKFTLSAGNPSFVIPCCSFSGAGACGDEATPWNVSYYGPITADGTYGGGSCGGAPLHGYVICNGSQNGNYNKMICDWTHKCTF